MNKLKNLQVFLIAILFIMLPICVNAKEKEYTPEYKEYLELSDEEKAKYEVIPRKYKDSISDFLDKNPKSGIDIFAKSAKLPEEYNLSDKIFIEIENQGSYGLCWDFAAMKSLETNLLLKERKIL